MRLINVRIENFGKLSDVAFDFSKDRQIFCEENGWGKSTLAAFLCVMFYGFDGDRKRDGLTNERKRYEPWQKGVYGGSVTFSVGAKTYRMSRVFGKKEVEDEFSLRMADNNRECDDYSTNIGEELFQIDRESFRRTIFLSQQDLETYATDAINAKIGNLIHHTDDVNNFATAYDRLKDMTNHMRPNHKKGSLKQMKEEMGVLENQIRNEESIAKRMEETTMLRGEQFEKSRRLQEDIAQMEKRQQLLSDDLDLQSERTEYRVLCNTWEEEKKAKETVEERFLKKDLIPDEEEVEDYQEQLALCRELEGYIKLNTLSEKELYLYDAIEEKWGDEYPTEEQITEMEHANQQLMRQRRELASSESPAASASVEKRRDMKMTLPFVIAGLIVIGLGVFAVAERLVMAGCVAIVVGVVVMLAGVFMKRNGNSLKVSEEITHQMDDCEKLAASIHEFLLRYAIEVNEILLQAEENWATQLAGIRSDCQQMKQWMRKKEDYKRAREAYLQQFAELREYLQSLGYDMEMEEDAERILRELLKNVRDHAGASERYERADKRKREFEKLHDMEKLMAGQNAGTNDRMDSGADPETLAGLTGQMQETREEQKRVEQLMREYDRRLEEDQQQWDAIQELKVELEDKQERYDEGFRKYQLLCRTMELLQMARDNLTAKYLQPVKDSFDKYYQMISGSGAEDYHFDAGVNLTVVEQGMQRETKFLSEGYRDMLGICTRLALVDAMYQEERPFLILDDPFVNLDQEKTRRALSFLENVSREYQIVYFTCHESRVP